MCIVGCSSTGICLLFSPEVWAHGRTPQDRLHFHHVISRVHTISRAWDSLAWEICPSELTQGRASPVTGMSESGLPRSTHGAGGGSGGWRRLCSWSLYVVSGLQAGHVVGPGHRACVPCCAV